jgi:hypothetical protein
MTVTEEPVHALGSSGTKAKPERQIRMAKARDRSNGAKSKAPKPRLDGPRRGSKSAKILAALNRPEGVALKDLVKITGWQPHSVRGFLSGVVSKTLGFEIRSTTTESGERRYRIMR